MIGSNTFDRFFYQTEVQSTKVLHATVKYLGVTINRIHKAPLLAMPVPHVPFCGLYYVLD